jgi:murein DD-endopeptidase MepM/ murein hydrolase activator NlpD
MAAKKYSAGAIFLQVVPVFGNVQDAIEREAKNIDRALGDTMEKSGEKAGKRAGKAASKGINEELKKGSGEFEREMGRQVEGINKALGGIDVKKLGNGLRRELAEVKKDLASLKDLDLTVDGDFKKFNEGISTAEARVRALRDNAKVVFRADIDSALKGFGKIEAAKAAISDPVEIEVRADTKTAERAMGAFERKIKDTMSKAASHMDGSLNGKIRMLKKELDDLGKLRVGVDIGSNRLRAEVGVIMRELEKLSHESVEIDAKFESGKAFAELAALDAALRKVDGSTVKINARADTKGAERNIFGLKRSSDDASNSFRSFSAIMLGVAAAGPALIPVLGAIAGGLLAIGPAAAVASFGLGAVLVGFSGLGDAISALQAKQDQQATTAQTAGKRNLSAANSIKDANRAVADAARGVADAQRGVADAQRGVVEAQRGVADAERSAARAAVDSAERVRQARQSAADGIRSALAQQASAQRSYRDAVDSVRDAERALREARADAAGTGEDLGRKIEGNKLAQDQGMLDMFNATTAFNAIMADGSSTNAEQEQARINMEQAQLRQKELRDEAKDLAAEKKKWDKQGVNGTEQVQSAQDALSAAIQNQRDAYRDLQSSAQAVDQARADGARMVKEAIEDQNRTIADGARAVADRKRDVADAKRAVEEARRGVADSQRTLERAREGVVRAKQSQDELNDSITSQEQAVNNAMAALGPAGRKFALFLFGLKEGFRDFRDDIQAVMLPAIQDAILGFIGSGNAGVVRGALIGLAASFGEFVKSLSQSFQGPAWGAFFQMLADLGPKIQKAYGGAFIAFLEAMASIMTTLAPFALQFARGLERLMESFAAWAASKEGADSIREFMEYAKTVGPDVLELFVALTQAALAIVLALAPYGHVMLDLITNLLDLIVAVDPKVLQAVVTAIFAVMLASQLAYLVMNILMAGTALLTSTVGLLVFALVGLGLIIYYVYTQNKTLGKILAVVAGSILAVYAAFKIYRTAMVLWAILTNAAALASTGLGVALLSISWPIVLIVAGIALLVGAIVWLWKTNETFRNFVLAAWDMIKRGFWAAWEMIKVVLAKIGDAAMWLWKNAIKPALSWIGQKFGQVFGFIKKIWNTILWPVIKAIVKVMWNLWKAHMKVVLVLVMAAFKGAFWLIKKLWENVLKPALGALADFMVWLWKNAVKPVLEWIGDKFETVFKGMKWVWDNILKPVFDEIAKRALPKLKSAFQTAVDAIKVIWDGLKAVVGKPIKFILDTVINKGLIDGFNKVAKWVGVDGFDHVPIPKSIQQYATGGVLPGYTPGRDPHKFVSPTGGRLELSGGEAIMRPEVTRVVGTGWVDRINKAARFGGVAGVQRAMGFATGGIVQQFARGGIVFPVRGGYVNRSAYNLGHDGMDINAANDSSGRVPFYSATSGVVSTTGYSRGYGNAVFVRSPYGELVYGHSTDGTIRVHPGQSVSPGTWLANIGNTGNSQGAHLHFGFPGGTFGQAEALLRGALVPGKIAAGASDGPSFPGWLSKIIGKPVDWIKGLYNKGVEKLTDKFGDSGLIDTLVGMGKKFLEPIADKIMGVVGMAGDAAEGAKVAVNGSVQRAVQEVAGAYGWGSGSQWAALQELVARESSWNPNAANPGSSARGLFQKMTSLHGPIESSVQGQARWGLDYIKRAYGTPIGAINFHDRNGRYKDVGVLPGGDATESGESAGGMPYNGTMMYDNGGYLPPGLTTVVNLTGKPEPVFTDGQFANLSGGGQGGNIHYEPHFEGSDLRAEDVAGDLNFTFRKIRRGGKYEGVGKS